ncbi:13 kDa ribonucleoprotein-associated protein [Verticillium dahliae VDG1]|nr:13 kDa ribonucleoprotein-associated protein [Verticillium dahliae VDG1]
MSRHILLSIPKPPIRIPTKLHFANMTTRLPPVQAPQASPSPPLPLPSTPVYFWRETDPASGFLSQWAPSPFPHPANPSLVFRTAEHYMMYRKAALFDPAQEAAILAAPHPRQAKALGRQVQNFDAATWEARREAIVTEGTRLKFTTGAGAAERRRRLLATGVGELVEASPFDPVWGVGFAPHVAPTVDREAWGLNLLGKALMVVRDELRAAEGRAGGLARDGGRDAVEGTSVN